MGILFLFMQDAKGLTGECAIHIACYTGNTGVVQVLINHGAKLKETSQVKRCESKQRNFFCLIP